MVGIPVTQQDINLTSGDISRALEHATNRANEFKQFLDQYSAQDLVDRWGFDLNDANVLKSAMGEMAVVSQAQADNRVFQAKIMGMGDV